MESWLFAGKLTLVLFFIVRWSQTGSPNGTAVVLFTLGYVIASTAVLLLGARAWRRTLLFAAIVIVLYASVRVDPIFSFLLPFAGAETVSAYSDGSLLIAFQALVPIVLIPAALRGDYLLCAAFAVIVTLMGSRARARLGALFATVNELHAAVDLQRRRNVSAGDYTARLQQLARLEERTILAREVHDRVGHAITGSVVQLEAACAILESDAERSTMMIRRSIETLRGGMDSIRETLRGLKPEPRELGIERLRALLERFSADTGFRSSVATDGDVGLVSGAHWNVMADIAREALTNSVKHSGAATVSVRVTVLSKLLKLEIRDDGRGTYELRKGLGLRGIEERTREAGGTVIFDGARGFSVIALFPLREADRGD